jgi:predicted RNA binding protein YcfA (HicA-like mRNA interferase family)
LREYGFDQTREGSNHTIFSDGRVSVPVPRHRQIASKTVMRIAQEIGVDWQQFKRKIS